MGFFEDVVGKLFGKQQADQPIIHEVMERTEVELGAYKAWKNSERRTDLVNDFDRAYSLKKQMVESSMEVHLLESQYSNGFAITYNDQIPVDQFKHLFDFLKDQILDVGYKLAQADRRIKHKGQYEESIEKWYLKPLAEDLQASVIDQRYGNVLIELVSIDRKPSYLKLMANVYQDRLYTKALPFEELYNRIISN